jgi:zinc transporter, ZIP family
MANLGAAAGWGLVVAASLLAGALAAVLLRLPERVAATATAFGGGILLAAVALELVPEADAGAGTALTAAGLFAGTLVYVGADAWLSRDPGMRTQRRMGHAAAAGRPMSAMASLGEPARGEPAPHDHAVAARGESIAAGIFVDGVPESIALGLTIAEGEVGAALLAGILLGNVVEAYGAAQPILAGGHTRRFALVLLGGIGLTLALATIVGGTLLADASEELVGTAQAVAAGAVLAVISIAIVPHAFSQVSRTVATATVAGFVAGYLLS